MSDATIYVLPDGSVVEVLPSDEAAPDAAAFLYRDEAEFRTMSDPERNVMEDYDFSPDFASTVPARIATLGRRLEVVLAPGSEEGYRAAMQRMSSFGVDGLEEFLEVGLFEEVVAFVGEHMRVQIGGEWGIEEADGWRAPLIVSSGADLAVTEIVADALEANEWPLVGHEDEWEPFEDDTIASSGF